MKEGTKYRIGVGMIIFLVLCALIADIIGLIPIAKDFTASIFWIGANLYFWRKGMGLFKGRKLAAMAVSWIAGLIPVIQEIPVEITLGIVAVIIMTRIEDRTGISVTKPTSAGTAALSARSVLNSGGRREPEQAEQIDQTEGRNANTQPLNIDGMRRAA